MVFVGCLGLALNGVAGCTQRVDSAEVPVAPRTPLLPIPTADFLPATAEQHALPPPATEEPQPIVGVNEEVQRAIRSATREVGIGTTYLMVVAARESSFDPRRHAHRTSATGLYQFTVDTWLRSVRAFGARHGLEAYARQITVDRSGAVSMRDTAARARLLRLRANPRLSALMAAELARDNAARLQRILGRPVTPAELYIAHLLGVTQAARVIEAACSAPHTAGARLLPAAARTNPELFKPRGRVASADAIVAEITAHYRRQEQRFVPYIGTNVAAYSPDKTDMPD
ncbi:MAG TPA: hypothetical protein VLX85_06935 [Stellaceae bacterium]|nr:hypothetical protein [Stellaceae bacterium]